MNWAGWPAVAALAGAMAAVLPLGLAFWRHTRIQAARQAVSEQHGADMMQLFDTKLETIRQKVDDLPNSIDAKLLRTHEDRCSNYRPNRNIGLVK